MVSGTRGFYRQGRVEPPGPISTYSPVMDLVIRLGLAVVCAVFARRQGLKAYRAAKSVIRPITPKSRPIGPEREQIPEWK